MTSFDEVKTGPVISYPYLRIREAGRGETAGRKLRASAVVLRLKLEGGADALVLPAITSKQPTRLQDAIEVPESEKRRAGLGSDKRLWVVLDEYNTDTVGQSFYLVPVSQIGHFSDTFFLSLLRAFAKVRLKARRVGLRQ
jgi:hypothetical protein